jgi:hypothetical protein
MKRLVLVAGLCAAATPLLAQERSEFVRLRIACEEDAKTLCAKVERGGGRVFACLMENKASLSEACRAALPRAAELMQQGQAPK